MKTTEYLETLNDWIVQIRSMNTKLHRVGLSWEWILSIHENNRFRKVDIHWFINVYWNVSKTVEWVRITLAEIIAGNNHDYVWISSKVEAFNGSVTKPIIQSYNQIHIQILTWLTQVEMVFLQKMKFVKNMTEYERQHHSELMDKIKVFQMEKSSGYKTLLNERNWVSGELELF